MTIPTLEEIKAAHTKVAEMIEAFEAAKPTVLLVPEASIELKPGERYAGLLLGDDGCPSHHVVLLPGEAEEVNWEAAKAWAIEAGGELPTRREQSLLFANLCGEFKEEWHWSGEERSEGSAWGQHFGNGYQSIITKNNEFRARAVRRLTA